MKKQLTSFTTTFLPKLQEIALTPNELLKIKGGGAIIIEEQIQG
jgi:hypothetical protein